MPRRARHPSISAVKAHGRNLTKRVETNRKRIEALQKQVKTLRSDLRSHTGNRRIHQRHRGRGGLEDLDKYEGGMDEATKQRLRARMDQIKSMKDELDRSTEATDALVDHVVSYQTGLRQELATAQSLQEQLQTLQQQLNESNMRLGECTQKVARYEQIPRARVVQRK